MYNSNNQQRLRPEHPHFIHEHPRRCLLIENLAQVTQQPVSHLGRRPRPLESRKIRPPQLGNSIEGRIGLVVGFRRDVTLHVPQQVRILAVSGLFEFNQRS